MSKKRRHHYVPVGLTQGFCPDADPNALFLYDAAEGRIIPSSPKDVFVKRDLHKIDLGEGKADFNTIEDMLSEFESNGVAAIRSYLEHGSLDPEARAQMACFLGLQVVRTPVMRAGAEQMLKEQVQTTAKILDDSKKLPPLPAALKERGNSFVELIQKNEIIINVLPQVTMISFQAWPTVAELVLNMNWCLMRSEDNHYFALSDNPCSIYDEHYGHHGMGIGVGHPGVEVVMPLDRHHCLLAAWKPIPELKRANQKHVHEINRRTALFGERFYAFPVSSKSMMELFRTYSGGQPETECVTVPAPKRKHRSGYLTFSSNIFSSETHNRLYLALRPIFPGEPKNLTDYRHLPKEFGNPNAGWFQTKSPARAPRRRK